MFIACFWMLIQIKELCSNKIQDSVDYDPLSKKLKINNWIFTFKIILLVYEKDWILFPKSRANEIVHG